MVELEEQTTGASRHIIERPRLTRLLDETTARVIMLVAPAGYGKTTLARQWLAKRPHAWFEASSALADVAGLIRILGEALLPFSEPDDGRLLDLLRSVHDASVLEAIANLQAGRIDPWPDDAWLAIDDYESISTSEASDAYVELLLRASTVNLLLTSRVMPKWATARKRLYGDYLIVTREQLAMTDAEARQVLQRREVQELPALISTAAGWPAVLGLASLSEAHEPSAVLPEALYDYFADELFQRASPSLRSALPQLALLQTVTPDIVAAGFGARDTPDMLREAKELGFLSGRGTALSFHPLLRAFLRRKEPSGAQHKETVDRLVKFLLDSQEWDEAFDVIRRASRREALVTLFELAHEPLLKSGRTATLAEWLAFAGAVEVHAPILDLIRAELAIREGIFGYAEELALRVAEQEGQRDACRALTIAGRAAHLDNREEAAFAHFRAAGKLAHDDRERHRAAWGALLAAPDFESDDELGLVVDTFFRFGTDSADDAVRAATAQFAVGLTRYGLSGVIEPALATLRTFGKSADPVAVTSLLNSLSRSLSFAARYEEALDLAEEELDVATSATLQFVIPYGHVSCAAALVGLGRYDEAEASLRLAIDRAEDIGDEHNVFDALTVRAKAAIAQGQVDRAAQLTATRDDTSGVSSGMHADYVATRGLALACAGRTSEAEKALTEAEKHSSIPEVVALVACSRAALALGHGSGIDEAAQALEQPLALMMFEPIVVACRGYPEMVDAVKATGRHLPQRLIDAMTAQRTPSERDRLLASLTPREGEVLELLARGYTNREIAATLVIAEVTAKVHVHRVIRKLGVRSRTEAAIAAVERGR